MESDTPRTDRFVREVMRPFVMPEGMPTDVKLDVAYEVRRLMTDWADYARGLERELMNSTPKEWKQ